jgi:hypothetical protein
MLWMCSFPVARMRRAKGIDYFWRYVENNTLTLISRDHLRTPWYPGGMAAFPLMLYGNLALPGHHKAAEIPQPGEGALDFPPALITAAACDHPAGGRHPAAAVRANQLNAALRQSLPQRVRIAGLIIEDALGLFTWSARCVPRDGNHLQGGLQPHHFSRGRRVQEVSQRNTLSVDHHHSLRPLAAFRLPDARSPFFAGAKLPSANASAQSSWPGASSRTKKARQALSHTPYSSQSRSRQQVLGDGTRSGRSFHRAPVRNIHRMPSNTGRFGIGFGSTRGDALSAGNNGAIFVHCKSVSSDCSLAIHGTSFTAYYSGGVLMMQPLARESYETASSPLGTQACPSASIPEIWCSVFSISMPTEQGGLRS